jgi:hypothetical protein
MNFLRTNLSQYAKGLIYTEIINKKDNLLYMLIGHGEYGHNELMDLLKSEVLTYQVLEENNYIIEEGNYASLFVNEESVLTISVTLEPDKDYQKIVYAIAIFELKSDNTKELIIYTETPSLFTRVGGQGATILMEFPIIEPNYTTLDDLRGEILTNKNNYLSKTEFTSWSKSHSHDTRYYRKGDTVNNTIKFSGHSLSEFALVNHTHPNYEIDNYKEVNYWNTILPNGLEGTLNSLFCTNSITPNSQLLIMAICKKDKSKSFEFGISTVLDSNNNITKRPFVRVGKNNNTLWSIEKELAFFEDIQNKINKDGDIITGDLILNSDCFIYANGDKTPENKLITKQDLDLVISAIKNNMTTEVNNSIILFHKDNISTSNNKQGVEISFSNSDYNPSIKYNNTTNQWEIRNKNEQQLNIIETKNHKHSLQELTGIEDYLKTIMKTSLLIDDLDIILDSEKIRKLFSSNGIIEYNENNGVFSIPFVSDLNDGILSKTDYSYFKHVIDNVNANSEKIILEY